MGLCRQLAGVHTAPARPACRTHLAAVARRARPGVPQLAALARRARPAGDRPLRPAGGVLPAGCSAHGWPDVARCLYRAQVVASARAA